ncbi:MAG: hypothetical protein Q7T01_04345 [bacterium]|nr:hypothetical protein [bacterium]
MAGFGFQEMALEQRRVVRHNPPELWFDGACAEDVRLQLVRATVRLGRRDVHHPKGYIAGERCRVRCRNGDVDALECWVRIRRLQYLRFVGLQEHDLAVCSSLEQSRAGLQRFLEHCYQQTIADDTQLTIVEFVYE